MLHRLELDCILVYILISWLLVAQRLHRCRDDVGVVVLQPNASYMV